MHGGLLPDEKTLGNRRIRKSKNYKKKNKITTIKFSINDIKVVMLGENCR